MSALRTAAGVACAPVGEMEVRKAGTPITARSLFGEPASVHGVNQAPARGQSGSFGNVEEITGSPYLGTVGTCCEKLVEYVPPAPSCHRERRSRESASTSEQQRS